MSDISGTWLGTYWQEGEPTRFEMTLVQGGNTLSGSILDDSKLGEATLIGEVIGRRVAFTKTYIGKVRHSLSYKGLVAEDENSMAGDWHAGRYQGTWEAYRGKDDLNAEFLSRLSRIAPAGVR
jgi:hypothetical protein